MSAKPDEIEGQPVPDVEERPAGTAHGTRNGAKLTYGAVLFEGRLEVTDREAFLDAIRKGIGSGKAYGFDLLSFAPVAARALLSFFPLSPQNP